MLVGVRASCGEEIICFRECNNSDASRGGILGIQIDREENGGSGDNKKIVAERDGFFW